MNVSVYLCVVNLCDSDLQWYQNAQRFFVFCLR